MPDLDNVDPSPSEQHRAYAASLSHHLPAEAAQAVLTCWIRLYGTLCMEVLHQLLAYWDMEPVFIQRSDHLHVTSTSL